MKDEEEVIRQGAPTPEKGAFVSPWHNPQARREIWACLLAYNLVQQTLLASALQADRSPRQLSFTAALQKIAAGWITVLVITDAALAALIEEHLHDLPQHRIGLHIRL